MAEDAAEMRAPIKRWAKAVRHGDPVIDSQLVTGRTGYVVAVKPGPHRQQPPRQIRAAMPRGASAEYQAQPARLAGAASTAARSKVNSRPSRMT